MGHYDDAAAIRLMLRPQGLLAPLDQPTSTPKSRSRRAPVLPGFHAHGLPPGRAGYDYLGTSDNSHGGTLTRWIDAVTGCNKRVVHEQVRQDRRDRRPLRSALISRNKRAVRALQRRSQPPLHIQQHPAAVGDRFHRFDHEVPGNGVEIGQARAAKHRLAGRARRWQRIAEGLDPDTAVDVPGFPPTAQWVSEIRAALAAPTG